MVEKVADHLNLSNDPEEAQGSYVMKEEFEEL